MGADYVKTECVYNKTRDRNTHCMQLAWMVEKTGVHERTNKTPNAERIKLWQK